MKKLMLLLSLAVVLTTAIVTGIQELKETPTAGSGIKEPTKASPMKDLTACFYNCENEKVRRKA